MPLQLMPSLFALVVLWWPNCLCDCTAVYFVMNLPSISLILFMCPRVTKSYLVLYFDRISKQNRRQIRHASHVSAPVIIAAIPQPSAQMIIQPASESFLVPSAYTTVGTKVVGSSNIIHAGGGGLRASRSNIGGRGVTTSRTTIRNNPSHAKIRASNSRLKASPSRLSRGGSRIKSSAVYLR